MTKPDNPGVGIKGRLVGVEPENEADHYYECAECGQTVDMRDLGQVLHHDQPGHKPIDGIPMGSPPAAL